MATAFYLTLVVFSSNVYFSFWSLLVSLFFSGKEAKIIYKYTTDPRLVGQRSN